MVAIKKKGQIKRLAAACEKACRENPELWINKHGECCFDFPDYGGLPEHIADKLSSDCVDVIQDHVASISIVNGQPKLKASVLASVLEEYSDAGYDLPY